MVQKTLANVANTVYIHLFRSTVTFKPGKHKTHFHAKSPDVLLTFGSLSQSNYIYIITLITPITLGQERHFSFSPEQLFV